MKFSVKHELGRLIWQNQVAFCVFISKTTFSCRMQLLARVKFLLGIFLSEEISFLGKYMPIL